MATATVDLATPFQQYDNAQLLLTVQGGSGAARDITNDRVIFHIDGLNLTKDSANGAAEVDKTDPVNGQATIKIDPGDLALDAPGAYQYEVVIIAVGVRATVVQGALTTDPSLITTT